MKEYKIGEIFHREDRTLMCVEKDVTGSKPPTFTNKLIFSVEGLTLQIKRKGCKVKVKVLELSEEFDGIENDNFTIYKANTFTTIYKWELGVYKVGDKIKCVFYTEQEAIDWVETLFSLRGEI